jgi:hypothetical protein
VEKVAYLLAADKYSGPLASWLIDTNQPVIRTRNAFSTLRLTQLVCIRAGLDHGVGHPLLLLYDAKVPNGKNNNEFKGLYYYPSDVSLSTF